MFSPHKHTRYTRLQHKVVDLLADLIMVIISQHIVYQIIMYTLNLHSVVSFFSMKPGKEISEWISIVYIF